VTQQVILSTLGAYMSSSQGVVYVLPSHALYLPVAGGHTKMIPSLKVVLTIS